MSPAHHRLPPPSPAMAARVAEARDHGQQGAYTVAEDGLLRVLALAEPDDLGARFEAWHYLSVVYGMLGRIFESHVCSRAACEIATGERDVVALSKSLPVRAATADALGCHADLAATLATLDESLLDAREHAPAWARQDYYEARVKLALHHCDTPAARLHLEAMREALATREDATALDHSTLGVLAARIAIRAGEVEEALAILADLPEVPLCRYAQVHGISQARTDALAAAGRMSEAHVEATAMLIRLEAQLAKPELASIRIEMASDLTRFWDRHPQSADHARRVRDVLATSILERIAQVDAWAIRLGDRAPVDAHQTIDVVGLRRQFEEEQQAALRQVASSLPQHLEVTDVLVDQDDGMAHLCAWCLRLRSAKSRKWLPLGHFVPREPPFLVSHGACPSCLEGLRKDARSSTL